MIQNLIKQLAKEDLFLVKGQSEGTWFVEVDGLVGGKVMGIHVASYKESTGKLKLTNNAGILNFKQRDTLKQINKQGVG